MPLKQVLPFVGLIAIGGLGAALSILMDEPSGMLVATAAVAAFGGWLSGLVAFATGLTVLLLMLADPGPNQDLQLAVFLGIAFAAGVLLHRLLRRRGDLPSGQAALTERIVESIPGCAWATDAHGRFTYLNGRVHDLHGAGKLVGLHSEDDAAWVAVHPDDVAQARQGWSDSLRTGQPYMGVFRIRAPGEDDRWHSAFARPWRDDSGRITGWYAISLDIHERKAAEETLRQKQHELQQLIDAVPALIWCATPEGEPSYINRRMAEYVGRALDDFGTPSMRASDDAIQRLVHPDDYAAFSEQFRQAIATGSPLFSKYRFARADGEHRWVETRAEPLRDRDGRILQWYGVNVDVHDNEEAREALQASERQLQLLADTMPVMVWSTNPYGEPTYINKRLADYVGLKVDDLDAADTTRLARAIEATVHLEDAERVGKALGRSFGAGEPFSMRYRTRRHDGAYRWVDGRAEPLRGADGQILQWYGVMIDVDDEIRMQDELQSAHEQLARAAQATSMAQLSASIAHEMNQPLAAIVNGSYALSRWLSADPPDLVRARASAERIVRDANAGVAVVNSVRALFRQRPTGRAAIDINDVIGEVCRLMADLFRRKRIQIVSDLGADLPPAIIDRLQIQQVLVNLIRNGTDAMEASADATKTLRINSRADEKMRVLVEILDEGPGLAEPERVFEPFYTTKQGGMGMGLAICRSIIEAHDGVLWAESAATHGARFVFAVPSTQACSA